MVVYKKDNVFVFVCSSEASVSEGSVSLKLGAQTVRLVVGHFKLVVDSFRNSKKNAEEKGFFENVFRYENAVN